MNEIDFYFSLINLFLRESYLLMPSVAIIFHCRMSNRMMGMQLQIKSRFENRLLFGHARDAWEMRYRPVRFIRSNVIQCKTLPLSRGSLSRFAL